MVNKYFKPVLGIKPRFLLDAERLMEIINAIGRFVGEYQPIPVEWIEEYNEIIERSGEDIKSMANVNEEGVE